MVDEYQARWMEREAQALGIPEEEREQFRVLRENSSTGREMGAIVLGQMVPLFLVVMVAVGCFIPAVDTTAGERERSTWETTMTISASRLSVVTAKYLHVAVLGIVAGVLNAVAVFVSMGAVLEPLLGRADAAFSFSIPWLAVPVMSLGAAALALFFAAAMMILAAFARTFKEGQAMVTPVYLLVLAPLLLGTQTDRTLTPVVAAVPVANVAMMIRDAITGVFLWPLIAETLAVTLLTVVACLALARAILRFEDFLLGSHDGSFWRFVTERLVRGRPDRSGRASAEAMGD
jgi:sodium transport system permease protein